MMLRSCRAPAAIRAPEQRSAPPVRSSAPTLPASGTGLAHWGSLHDVWQEAMDRRPGDTVRAKEPLPIGVVIAIVEHRVRAVRVLRDALDCECGLRQRIETLQPHARDPQGRNWNIRALACGTSPPTGHEADFRRVVDMLRDQFDLV